MSENYCITDMSKCDSTSRSNTDIPYNSITQFNKKKYFKNNIIIFREHRLRVFENRVLRRIFGSKRDGVTGECRKLHNEELNNLYCSPNIVRVIKKRRMRWAVHIARMGEM